MVEQKSKGLVNRLRFDNVVVVEHEHELVRDGGDVIQQRPQRRLDRWRLGRIQQREGILANPRLHRLQCSDEVSPEQRWLIVVLVKRDPCPRPFAGRGSCQPFSQHRRLAETRRRGDQGQLALDPLVQALDQSRTRYQPRTPLGDIELGLK